MRDSRSTKAGAVAALDLGGTKLAWAAVAADGRMSKRQAAAVDATSPLGPVRQMVTAVRELQAKHALRAIGVAVPGLVRRDGTVWAPNLPEWERVPLARMLGQATGLPVVVESDRNAAVLGEAWRGAARSKQDVVVLIVGTGIGAGILSGGTLVRGAHELSGCAGWMVISELEHPEFRRVGCLEALAAGPGLARVAQEAGAQARTAAELAEAARGGNAIAREQFQQLGRRLGLAVANLISLFDPEVVVLAGGMAGAADLYFEELERVAHERSQPLAASQVRIAVSKLADGANLLGAAQLAWRLHPTSRNPKQRARAARRSS